MCGNESMAEKQRLSTEEVIRRIKEVHGDRFEIPSDFEYKSNMTKVKLICKEHGEFWQVPIFLWRGVGCPKCNRSKLERELCKLFEDNSIEYEEQKHFPWLGLQELDFYLPSHNLAIECQGLQHFTEVDFHGNGIETATKHLEAQIILDERKKERCEENGVRLIYYTHVKDVEDFEHYNHGLYDGNLYKTQEELLDILCRETQG